jgi:glutamyl-tRNA synthetase
VKDFWELSDYFFTAPTTYNEKAVKKQWKEDTPDIMKGVIDILKDINDFESAIVEEKVKAWIGQKELSFGKVMPPLRLVIVGDMKGPHLFDIMALIGKEESVKRISTAIEQL